MRYGSHYETKGELPLKLLLLISLAALLPAATISQNILSPETAVGEKVYSPDGVYGFWLTQHSYSYDVPVMDGPLGLILANAATLQIDGGAVALVDNTGLAVMSYWATGDAGLHVFDYAAGGGAMVDIWSGYRQVDGGIFIPQVVNTILPLSLSNRLLTAMVFGWESDWNGGRERTWVSRWDFAQPGAMPTLVEDSSTSRPESHIPEPGTWRLMVGGILLMIGCRRRGST